MRRTNAPAVRLALVACCIAAAFCSAAAPTAARADNQSFRTIKPSVVTASWDVPDSRSVRAAAFAFLASQDASDDAVAKAAALWPVAGEPRDETFHGGELVDRLAALVALVEPRAADVFNYAKGAGPLTPWPHAAWLADEKTPALVRDNLCLLVTRRLVESRRFEDVLDVLKGLDADDVADPAALLFARAVAEHQLVRPEACAATAATLLENERLIPTRYAAVARLLRADIEGVEHGSLDEIARRMGQVGRRIEIGQAGPRTNELATDVVKSLDDLIKKAEDERKKREQSPGTGQASGQPAQESRPLEGKGEGKVDHKPTGGGRDWGNLPAKVRDAALQQIGKDFPAHYREIIEEYFRRLAAEEE
ncbi:MAG: hypothetical protein WD875_13245 [Pirellulales bacterium]